MKFIATGTAALWRAVSGTALFAALLFAAPALAGWQLTFSDEFSGSSLDRTKWKTKDLWNNQVLSGNGEQECYLPDQFESVGGALRIRAEVKSTPQDQCWGAQAAQPYASGEITTAGCNPYESGPQCSNSFSQKYGYFEMNARLPKGKGFWPAFWLIPIDGSWPPEIDIMEQLGHDMSTMYMTYHWSDSGGNHQSDGAGYTSSVDYSSGYHRFAIDWQPGLLIWYVDGVERKRHSGPDVTDKAMYIIANLGVGGYWPGNPDASTPFPSYMDIDYIRVYARVNDGMPDAFPPGVNGVPAPSGDAQQLPTTPSAPPVTQVVSASATLSASNVLPGETLRITPTVSATANLIAGELQVNVVDSSRNFLWKNDTRSFTVSGGTSQSTSVDYVVPTDLPAGTYHIELGVFTTNWASNLVWNDKAATFTVGSAPTAQPPPVTQQPPPPVEPPPVNQPPPPPVADNSGWTFCAFEGQQCSFPGTMIVRYGVEGAYVQKTVSGGTSCSNDVFSDPAYGIYKHCDIMASSSMGPIIDPTPRPPSVDVSAFSISSPSPSVSEQVSGQINITGVAGSQWLNVGVFDGNWNKLSSDITPSNGAFSIPFNTTQFANGTVSVRVVAFSMPAGQPGGTYTEIGLTLNVQNPSTSVSSSVSSLRSPPPASSSGPSVNITSPAPGSSVKKTAPLLISADVTDSVAIKTVKFYVKGSLKCTVSSAPYQCATKAPRTRGNADIKVLATDVSAKSASATVTIKVQ